MKKTTIFLAGAMSLSLSALSLMASANTIDADDFVEDASAQGIAEIEAGKMALQKSSSSAVKVFAQHIIDDHTAANKELAALAKSKNLEVDDEAALMSKAKGYMLKQKEGQSFDAAFASNQVTAHEKTIELFQKAAKSDDAEVRAFAEAKIPTLEKHLHAAHELAATTMATKIETKVEKNVENKAKH